MEDNVLHMCIQGIQLEEVPPGEQRVVTGHSIMETLDKEGGVELHGEPNVIMEKERES